MKKVIYNDKAIGYKTHNNSYHPSIQQQNFRIHERESRTSERNRLSHYSTWGLQHSFKGNVQRQQAVDQ